MDPHIVRHIDKRLLEKSIELYQKKYSEITEEDWDLIIKFRDLVRLSTLHLYPEFKEPPSFLQSADLNNDYIDEYANKYNEDFQKRFQFYLKIAEIENNKMRKERIINLPAEVKNEQWEKIFSRKLPEDLDNSVYTLFWIKLFQKINFSKNWLNSIDEKFDLILNQIINEAFKNNEQMKIKYMNELMNKNYQLIIDDIISIESWRGCHILSTYTKLRKSFVDKQPHEILNILLIAQ